MRVQAGTSCDGVWGVYESVPQVGGGAGGRFIVGFSGRRCAGVVSGDMRVEDLASRRSVDVF